MGFVLQASCSKCNYLSRKLIVGDGMHFIFVCESCNSVVNAQRMPFRYTLSACPNCTNPLRQSGWVDALSLVTSYHEPVESVYQCPHCKESPLGFKAISHFSRSFDERVPEVGMLVHGRFSASGKLEIPFLNNPCCITHLEGAPPHAPDQIMELRVTQLEGMESSVGLHSEINIFFEFVRYVSEEDLERESMEQPQFKSKTREFLKAAGSFTDE